MSSVKDVVKGLGPTVGAHHNGNGNVYMGHKILKLQDQMELQELDSQIRTKIFENCAIFVNGITNPPARELSLIGKLHNS
jgi:hypothetical protein